MKVTTTTLQMLTPPVNPPRSFPPNVHLERSTDTLPEFARFLYGLVGGDWRWTDRLDWTQKQWQAELDVFGTEFWILYCSGQPIGYAQLQPSELGETTQVELRYFGLSAYGIALGGLGGALLEHAVRAAWTLSDRFELAEISRVWVHTCSLDSPAALANYQARGFVICAVEESEQEVLAESIGSWRATGGAA